MICLMQAIWIERRLIWAYLLISGGPIVFKWVDNCVKICRYCMRMKSGEVSKPPFKPLPIPENCWWSVCLDFIFGYPDNKAFCLCQTYEQNSASGTSKKEHFGKWSSVALYRACVSPWRVANRSSSNGWTNNDIILLSKTFYELIAQSIRAHGALYFV